MTEYLLENYIDDNGREPVKVWLNTLDCTSRKRVLIRLRRLEAGNFGDFKKLNDALYELRFTFGSGYRIYFTLKDNTVILLISGGDKKTQTKDIQKANNILAKLKGINDEQ